MFSVRTGPFETPGVADGAGSGVAIGGGAGADRAGSGVCAIAGAEQTRKATQPQTDADRIMATALLGAPSRAVLLPLRPAGENNELALSEQLPVPGL